MYAALHNRQRKKRVNKKFRTASHKGIANACKRKQVTDGLRESALNLALNRPAD